MPTLRTPSVIDYATKIEVTNAIGESRIVTLGDLATNPYYAYVWGAFEREISKLVRKETAQLQFNHSTYALAKGS